jgi:hypothetical protein
MGRVRPETNFSLSSSFIARLLVGAKFDLPNLGARQDGAFQEGGEIVAAHAAHGPRLGSRTETAARSSAPLLAIRPFGFLWWCEKHRGEELTSQG